MNIIEKNCRICGRIVRPFLDLGRQPLANSLLKLADSIENKYPLILCWCPGCSLVQLNYTVDPKKLFSKYVWVTGTSKQAKAFSEDFYNAIIRRTPDPESGYVLELASNDGTFLLPFIKNGYNALGIDPAQNIVKIAKKQNVPTIAAFWDSKTAKKVLKKSGSARIIFARNVLAHIADTADFIRAAVLLLQPDGVFAAEVHYAGAMLKELQYDSVYHEHLCYFTFKPLEWLLNKFGLYVFDVMKSPISGGAIVVYASKKPRQETIALKNIRTREKKDGLNTFTAWSRFAARALLHREEFIEMLAGIKKKKARIIGWGASARSSTLLNFCGLNSDTIPIIADKNKFKHGLYTAGSRILVKSPDYAMKTSPQYVVILGWNFKNEITGDLKSNFKYRGKCITPFPYRPRVFKI